MSYLVAIVILFTIENKSCCYMYRAFMINYYRALHSNLVKLPMATRMNWQRKAKHTRSIFSSVTVLVLLYYARTV